MAGNALVRMPVLYRQGFNLLHSTVDDVQLIPFGFSEKPISIEGVVQKPANLKPQRKKYRLFFESNHLQPRWHSIQHHFDKEKILLSYSSSAIILPFAVLSSLKDSLAIFAELSV